ncbi:hypothetical protein, partial [Actinoplanes sp. NPDC048796]|uniref:hypothetical protein n=1 Tax=Actinoplanes sp. NPDC048796 TaxID=3155640 RepID=UPI0033D17CED
SVVRTESAAPAEAVTHPELAVRAEVVEQREPTNRAAAKPGSALRAGVAVLCGSVVRARGGGEAQVGTPGRGGRCPAGR